MSRLGLLALVAGCLAIVGACHDAESPEAAPRPVGDLHGATPIADGDTVWVLGGTVVPDDVWSEMTTPSVDLSTASERASRDGTNHALMQYDRDGKRLQNIDLTSLGLGGGVFGLSLADPTATTTTTGTVLAGSGCSLNREQGCSGIDPLVIAVHEGRASLVPLPSDLPSSDEVRVVGAIGAEALVVVGPNPGTVVVPQEDLSLVAVDPSTGRAKRIVTLPGARFTKGVCVHEGDVLVATVTVTVGPPVPASFQVTRLRGLSPDPDVIASVQAAPNWAGDVLLSCTDGGVRLVEQNVPDGSSSPASTTIWSLDVADNAASAPWTGSAADKVIAGQATVGDDLVLMEGQWPRRWSKGKLGPPGTEADDYFTRDRYFRSVGGRMLDVRGLLATPPWKTAPAPVEVVVPPVA